MHSRNPRPTASAAGRFRFRRVLRPAGTSRGIMAGMGIGLGAIVVAAAYAARQVIGEPSAPVDVTLLAIAGGLVIAWLVQPLLGLGRSAPLPRPSQAPAPDQPAKPVPYDMTEPEWIRGACTMRRAWRGGSRGRCRGCC